MHIPNISEVTSEEALTEDYSQSNDDVSSQHEPIVLVKKKSSISSISKVNLNDVSLIRLCWMSKSSFSNPHFLKRNSRIKDMQSVNNSFILKSFNMFSKCLLLPNTVFYVESGLFEIGIETHNR